MKNKTKTGWGALFAIFAFSMAQIANAADVTGTWNMTVETGAGTGTPVFVLAQKGDTLSGSYKGQLGEAPVTGTITGDDVAFQFTVDAQGQTMVVKYTGKVDGKSMSGKVSLGTFAEGTFKGTKQ